MARGVGWATGTRPDHGTADHRQANRRDHEGGQRLERLHPGEPGATDHDGFCRRGPVNTTQSVTITATVDCWVTA